MIYLLRKSLEKVSKVSLTQTVVFKVEQMSKFGESAISKGTDVPTYKSH